MREKRKKEHVENYLRTTFKGVTLLEDVFLQHNALPDLNFEFPTQIEFSRFWVIYQCMGIT